MTVGARMWIYVAGCIFTAVALQLWPAMLMNFWLAMILKPWRETF